MEPPKPRFSVEDYGNMVFLPYFKSPQFKQALGYTSVKQDHDRKSYDYEGLRECVYRYTVKDGKVIFLVIQYEPQFLVSNKGLGVLNHFSLGEMEIRRNLVRQVRISSGMSEGYVLYSFIPDYGSIPKMVGFLSQFIRNRL